jgi:methionyl-tRNA formyltransferase
MRLIFMGTPAAAVPTLRRCLDDGHEMVAVWTQPDRPSGRGNRLHASPVKEFALQNNLTVHQPLKIKTDEARELFASYRADAAVVVAYGRILPPAFLRAPRLGCINVHFSLLPKYRGAAPVNWAIVHGERETGVTTMRMDEGLDTGDILLQRATRIGADETAPQLLERLSEIGADVLSETLKRIHEIEPRQQNDAEKSFAPILKREDGLIDWRMSAPEIRNRVRGFQPFPNAYTLYHKQRLIIWRAEVLSEDEAARFAAKEAGEIVTARGEDLIIRCGADSALRLTEVQAEGKRRMSARDFLNGARLQAGDRFGE